MVIYDPEFGELKPVVGSFDGSAAARFAKTKGLPYKTVKDKKGNEFGVVTIGGAKVDAWAYYRQQNTSKRIQPRQTGLYNAGKPLQTGTARDDFGAARKNSKGTISRTQPRYSQPVYRLM